jgi:hypothetical protein
MREADIEVILERAKEKNPEAKDNGLQFIARNLRSLFESRA